MEFPLQFRKLEKNLPVKRQRSLKLRLRKGEKAILDVYYSIYTGERHR